MEWATKLAWALLLAIHIPPAAVIAAPSLLTRLYQVEASGDLVLLLKHRGVLFVAIAAGCLMAIFEPQARRALAVLAAISIVGFLALYLAAQAPAGALRGIAIWDAIALAPLIFVTFKAWRHQAA